MAITMRRRYDAAALALLSIAFRSALTAPRAASLPAPVQNSGGLKLLVAEANTDPTLRIVLPGHAESDRAIEVVFPEHVTVRRHGSTEAEHLYLFRPGTRGEPVAWQRNRRSLEYERDLPAKVHMRARATLEQDGVRFQYRFSNRSDVAYDMVYAVTDPRLTSIFHDPRLERTYIHHPDGFALLAAETPDRLTMPLDQWLPCRYLASYTWPVPAARVERRGDGITYYNASRAVDQPFIATLSIDHQWVVASFTRQTGNVWSNPALTCQHVDPQTTLPPHQEAVLEVKLLILRGSLDDALQRAIQQRHSLK
jgi:hypothetical protein